MLPKKKQLRYYWWIIQAFSKKHAKLILLSFFLSVISVVSLISISPYFLTITSTKKQVIGIVGTYDYNNLPDFILSKISNGLVFVNDKGVITPALAEDKGTERSFKQNGIEYTEYTYKLRKNLTWNDGKPFKASDVSYKFKDVDVKYTDDRTIKFTLKKLSIFPTYLVQPIIKYPLIGVAGLYKIDRRKVIQSRSTNQTVKELDLSPNRSDLPFIIYKFYDTEAQMINAYKLGEIMQMNVSRKSIADTFSHWKNTEISKTIDYTHLITLFFSFSNPLLKEEKDVRQAIAQSISKDFINEYGEEATGPIPPVSWAYQPNLKKVIPNPELSEKIIRKYIDASHAATLNLVTSYDYLNIADQIKGDIEGTGFKVTVNTLSPDQGNQFDMLLASWKVPTDPDQYYFWHSKQPQGNITKYENLKVDSILEHARSDAGSIEERKAYYSTFQKLIVDDVPAYFLYYPYAYMVKRK